MQEKLETIFSMWDTSAFMFIFYWIELNLGKIHLCALAEIKNFLTFPACF